MKTLSPLRVALHGATSLLLGATIACGPGAQEPAPAPSCPDENRVVIDGHKYCVIDQTIIEKGFLCPADLANYHQVPGANGAVCSDMSALPEGDVETLVELVNDPPGTGAWIEPPEPMLTCSGANPAEQGCSDDTECNAGESCVLSDASVCVPSSCSCDATTGDWTCTADCGELRECAPSTGPATCGGLEDPSAQECNADTDCASGQICQSDAASCKPSTCNCDASSGAWACTRDCGPTNTCVDADAPATCGGVGDPSAQECDADTDCASGESCVESDADVCIPSSCFCDIAGWGCTEDCGTQRVCADTDAPATCGGLEDPSAQECNADTDCASGQICQSDAASCKPSTCNCDASSGAWACTRDCGPTNTCVDADAPATCDGVVDPSVQECDADTDCASGESCVESDADVCIPSSCFCDIAGWGCTEDCGTPRVCASK